MSRSKFVIFLTIFLSIHCFAPVFSQNSCHAGSEPVYSDTLEALHYGIHLTEVDMTSKTIRGYTDLTLLPRMEGLSEVKLELLLLTVDSVQQSAIPVTSFSHEGSLLRIPLFNPAGTGDTVHIRVYYHGSVFVDLSGWGGFHFSGDYAFNLGVGFDAIPHNLGKAWFPCIDDFRDRALYDVYLTVPSDKSAISGGLLEDVTDHGDNTSTWHWKTTYSLPTYLISASIGKYSLVSDSYDGLGGTVPVTYYCRPSDTSRVAGTFIHMKEILQLFESHFGPYPLERVGYTATAQGAMEHACNISYPYSGWNGNTSMEWWYTHELSHMWFGDAVTCASAEDMWLNEGWAVWCESLYLEFLYGKEVAREYIRGKLKNVILQTHMKDGGYYAVYGIPQTITYGSTVYEKGGQVTHTLRHYLGDSLFFSGIKAYLQEYAYRHASSCDLRDFLSTYTGVDLNDFFDAWVFSPGFYNFSVDHMEVEPAGNGYQVTVHVRQRLHEAPDYANSNHLEITFIGAGWQRYTQSLAFSGANGQATFLLPFEPVEAVPDMDEKISDAALSFEAVIRTSGELDFSDTYGKVITSQVTDSAWVRITHNWASPEPLQVPVPGMRISDARYWKVEGIFPRDYRAKGKFFYNRNTLDNTLITGPNDSLVILYRRDGLADWKGVSFTRFGSNNIGYITVDSLARGEYTLAVWDKTYGYQEHGSNQGYYLNIYPNPSREYCTIELESRLDSRLCIYDSLGKMLEELPLAAGKHAITWNRNNRSSGVYYFKMKSVNGLDLVSQTMIIQ